jgi:hypothetical protein
MTEMTHGRHGPALRVNSFLDETPPVARPLYVPELAPVQMLEEDMDVLLLPLFFVMLAKILTEALLRSVDIEQNTRM